MPTATLLARAGSLAVVTLMTTAAHAAEPTTAPTTQALAGPFQPTWGSLATQQTPDWFRDAKFGIWAHWGPQCAPEAGDWYARSMYSQGNPAYQVHLQKYGHPSTVGFKDVIHQWRAERWDPEALVALYRRAGAQYFMALANHHDNFDLWDSAYQPWNSVALGPKQNIIAGWAAAARKNGLKFGVSVHAAHAWSWYEPAQAADATGPLAGVPYDGKLTKADGAGTWWEGLDPQDLYAQAHAPSEGYANLGSIHNRWDWDNGCSVPDAAYCERFYNRTIDLVDKYQPDLIYFDDTALPLYPISDVGLRIAAHAYNASASRNHGENRSVIFGKVLTEPQRHAITWDVERGASNRLEPLPWQTCTCIGDWHYNRAVFDQHRYKSASLVMQMLADVVSKNGNLLLSVPVRGDGTIDEDETKIVEGIAAWMDVNREAIFGTRPFKVFGEGPASDNAAALSAQGFNEGKVPFTAADVRFTTKGDALYVIALGFPDKPLAIRSLGKTAGNLDREIASITLLGSDEPIRFERDDAALTIQPATKKPCEGPVVFRVMMK